MRLKCPRHSTDIAQFKHFTDLTQFKYAFNVIQNWEMVALQFYLIIVLMFRQQYAYGTGCKESWFYGLPFGQVVASMY